MPTAPEATLAALGGVDSTPATQSPTEAIALTFAEAAKALRISERKLSAIVKAGEIRSILHGARRMFFRRDLVAWAESRCGIHPPAFRPPRPAK